MSAADVASALDMALEDVIKIKGRRGGGRGPKKADAGKPAGSRKVASEVKPKETSQKEKRTGNEKPPEETTDIKGGGHGVRRLREVTAKQALAPAAKAAAAAAKATATATTAAVTGAAEVAAKVAAKAGISMTATATVAKVIKAAAPPKSVVAPQGTEEKLQMSLEDLLKFEVKQKKAKSEKTEKAAEGGSGDGAGLSENKVSGRRKVMKLRSTPPKAKAKAKAKVKAKGKAKATVQARGKFRMQDNSFWHAPGNGGHLPSTESWRRGNDFVTRESRRRPSGSGMYADWNTDVKRKAADDWGTPPKKRMGWMSDEESSGFGWGRSGNSSLGWGSRGNGRSSAWSGGNGSSLALGTGGSCRSSERWVGSSDHWGGSSASDRGAYGGGETGVWGRALARAWGSRGLEWNSASRSTATSGRRVASGGGSCRIKVSGVPKNLNWRDIQEAFEENGHVTHCEVEKGVAYVTFGSTQDAKKAVQIFDRGELNGETIFVSHE